MENQVMRSILLAAAAVLTLSSGNAFALRWNSAPSISHDSGQTVLTPRGPIVTTGRLGQMQTTTMPGVGGQGLLMDNGNGTGTLIGSNGTITSVQIPR